MHHIYFYQPCNPAGHKIALHFPRLSVGLCIPTYHMYSNYIMCIVAMPFYFSQLRQFGWLLYVATMNSLAQIRVWDRYIEGEAMWTRQHEADRWQKCQRQAVTHDAYRVANQLRMASSRALEWIKMLKVPAGF